MERQLLRLILNYSFYKANKDRVIQEYFPDNLQKLYKLIVDKHETNQKDLSVEELKALYRVNYPATTKAQLDLIFEVLDTLPGELSEDVAKEVLQKAFILEQGRQIAQIGIDIVNGKEANFEEVRKILSKVEQGELSSGDDLEPVSNELEDILAELETTTKWSFNLAPLRTVCPGIGPGIFTIVGARVETGKTAFGVSITASPDGIADQGGLVHFYCNEESPQRTQARAVMAYTGMPLQEILLNKEIAKKKFKAISDRICFYDCRGKSIYDIERHIAKHSPDTCIVDQLDKLSIQGSFAREDERLGALYIAARNIGSVYNTAMVGISQLNAESEGQTYISSANFANARTSKAAEADILLGIGKSPIHEENTRIINVIKNKISGLHNEVICMIRPEISRYVA